MSCSTFWIPPAQVGEDVCCCGSAVLLCPALLGVCCQTHLPCCARCALPNPPACLSSCSQTGLTPSSAERAERRRQATVRLRAAFAGGMTAEADVLSLAAQLSGSAGSQLADQLVAEPLDPNRFMAGGQLPGACWAGCWSSSRGGWC